MVCGPRPGTSFVGDGRFLAWLSSVSARVSNGSGPPRWTHVRSPAGLKSKPATSSQPNGTPASRGHGSDRVREFAGARAGAALPRPDPLPAAVGAAFAAEG